MKYLNYDVEEKDTAIIIRGITSFNLKHIFECGQAFRWRKCADSKYLLIAMKRVIEMEKRDDQLIIYNSTLEDFKSIWIGYFDLITDYSSIKKTLAKDQIMGDAVKFGDGIRILKQDFWEMLISFIISANNRIPMIMKTIDNISRKFGEQIKYKGKMYYTFPESSKLANADVEEVRLCKAGYRSEYIIETAKYFEENIIDLEYLKSLESEKAVAEMRKLKGVGAKVASCVLLFSGIKQDVFPIDVWVERVMKYLYFNNQEVKHKEIKQFADDYFGKLTGFAQQYLFYYARENKLC